MIIDITGFGWSGSGAIIDLLREYDDIQISKSIELSVLYNVDGIKDLEYKLLHKHCRTFDSDVAIKRFFRLIDGRYSKIIDKKISLIARQYIENLSGINYTARSIYDRLYFPSYKYNLSGYYNRFIGKFIDNRYLTPVLGKRFVNSLRIHHINTKYLSYNPDNFLVETQLFMKKLLDFIKDDSGRDLVTDHMFPPDNPTPYFKFVQEPIKCIVVRRDPRDTYILAKEIYAGAIPIPVDSVEKFIWFYKHIVEEQKIENSTDILNLNFEDLIYNYNKTIKRIESFLNINEHNRIGTFFFPEKSINNTQLFKHFRRYEDDIKLIEEQLNKSLYPFDNYSDYKTVKSKIF